MKLKLLFLLPFLCSSLLLFSQTEKDSISLEEEMERYEEEEEIDFEAIKREEREKEEKAKQQYPEEKIFKVVEDYPRFLGCDSKDFSLEEVKKCVEEKMYEFIYANLKYPERAKEHKTEGRVFVQFVLDRDMSIQDVKVIKDIGNGCGKEAVRVVKLMPNFIQTKSRSKPVKVLFTLPIEFKLDN